MPATGCAADIGTDHGYVPIALAHRGDVSRIIGMDVRTGPLGKAATNVAEAGLENIIELRLSDGAEALQPGEAQVIVVAGMGGELMQGILSRGAEVFQKAEHLVLGPQSELADLRRFLCENGYCLDDEEFLWDEGKPYFLWDVHYEPERAVPMEDWEYLYGRSLRQKKDPAFREYLEKEKKIWGDVQSRVATLDSEAARKKRDDCESRLQMIEKNLQAWAE